jgi:hypothetical protein
MTSGRAIRAVLLIAAICVVIFSLHAARSMGTMVAATGPGNVTCDEFRELGPAKRAQALAWAQGYAAALNLSTDIASFSAISITRPTIAFASFRISLSFDTSKI